MKGTLTLIPTPIDDESLLEPRAFQLLKDNCDHSNSILLVEEHRAGRRRWLRFGLPREAIEKFEVFNEHNKQESSLKYLHELQAGKNIYLMSDCGLPAFCDPGRDLIDLCHQNDIRVTSTPFHNSIVLALALSGFNHSRFMFEGFAPQKTDERILFFEKVVTNNMTTIIMDTPYRLTKVLEEIQDAEDKKAMNRKYFLGLELNKTNEKLIRGDIRRLIKKCPQEKLEFILVVE